MTDAKTVRLRCPECYRECGWCSWYAMNAREAGCGSIYGDKCAKAEALKGTKCGTCDGSGVVAATIDRPEAAR